MKEFVVFTTDIQNEALINEFKGNLFEYLVGLFLAREGGLEGQYLESIREDFLSQLKSYEKWLRHNDPELLAKLPVLAKSASDFLMREKIRGEKIHLIGKVAAGSHVEEWHEADLLLFEGDREIPLSLKLCKEKAFVNTKSAGVKSFLEKYFAIFPKSKEDQKVLNDLVEKSFHKMGHALYEQAGIEDYDSFGPNWDEQGLSHLPGELPREMKEGLYGFYHEVIGFIFESFKRYLEKNCEQFKKCLLPIAGLGNEKMLQLTCFHKDEGESRYELSHMHFLNAEDFKHSCKKLTLVPLKENLASFELELVGMRLQIRVKPMNRFTTPALKINCSVKY